MHTRAGFSVGNGDGIHIWLLAEALGLSNQEVLTLTEVHTVTVAATETQSCLMKTSKHCVLSLHSQFVSLSINTQL